MSPWDFVPGGKPQEIEDQDWSERALATAQIWAARHNAMMKMRGEEQNG